MKQLISRWSSIYVTKPSSTGTRRILCSLVLKYVVGGSRQRYGPILGWGHVLDQFPLHLWAPSPAAKQIVEMEHKKTLLSLFIFLPLWGAARNFFNASSDSLFHPPLSLVFFFQSSSSPPFLTSLLTQSSHLSLGLPRLLLPCSRNSSALFGSLPSAILSTYPAHNSLLLDSRLSAFLSLPLTSPFFSCRSAVATLAIFLPSCFRTLATFVVVVWSLPGFPFRTGMPVSHKCLRPCPWVFLRSAGPPSPLQLLSTRSFQPVLFDVPLSLSVFPSPHTAPPMYTKLFPWVSFFPSSSMSSSSLWWPMCSTSVFSRFIFSPCQVNSPFYSSSVSCSSCLSFATRARSSA